MQYKIFQKNIGVLRVFGDSMSQCERRSNKNEVFEILKVTNRHFEYLKIAAIIKVNFEVINNF